MKLKSYKLKLHTGILTFVLLFSFSATAKAENIKGNDYSTNSWDRFNYNYEFESGANYNIDLGKPTTTDITANPQNQNTRINKDFALTPLPYGIFSSEIETEQSNSYFSPSNYATANATNVTSQSTTLPDFNYGGNKVSISYDDNTSTNNSVNTLPLYYDDGHIGTLEIERYNRKMKVWEGESLENLDKGVGHFAFTSAWEGNVGIAGHNDDEFENLHKLRNGDIITYKTKYGMKEYEITDVYIIDENDFTPLEYTDHNRLTMITCVENKPNKRYCVVAEEK